MIRPGYHFAAIAVSVLTASDQTPERSSLSSVSGTVFDSVSATALRGASVQIVGAADSVLGRSFAALTDSLGRYVIRGVPFGRYVAGFQHLKLDSLGLEIEDVAVTVGEENVRLDLATPSTATYVGMVCPDHALGGLLVGHVRQTGTGSPLPNARVLATWTELDTTNVFAAQRTRERTIRAAPSGWYALCGLPSDVALLVRAASGADSSGYVRSSLPTGGVRMASFFVGGAERVTSTTESGPQIAWRGKARLSGTVYDGFGQIVPNARLSIWGTAAETSTDGQGRFRLGALPGGTQTVEVRALGFEPVQSVVVLSEEDPATMTVLLRNRLTELGGVTVTANAEPARLRGFHDRMRDAERGINHGYFITPEELERRKPTLITNMFEGLNGIRVQRILGSLDPKNVVVRGALRDGGNYCLMTVYLDGIRVQGPAGGGFESINYLINPATVAAIEVYQRPVSAPPQYQSLNGTCGVILIWTK